MYQPQSKNPPKRAKRGSYKNPAQRQRVVRDYLNGTPKSKIAKKENIDRKTVNNILLVEIPKELQEAAKEKTKALLYGALEMAAWAYVKAMVDPADHGNKAADFLERMTVLPAAAALAQTIDVTHEEKPTTFEEEVNAYAVRALKNAAMRAALHGEGLPVPRPEPDIPMLQTEIKKKQLRLAEVLKLEQKATGTSGCVVGEAPPCSPV